MHKWRQNIFFHGGRVPADRIHLYVYRKELFGIAVSYLQLAQF